MLDFVAGLQRAELTEVDLQLLLGDPWGDVFDVDLLLGLVDVSLVLLNDIVLVGLARLFVLFAFETGVLEVFGPESFGESHKRPHWDFSVDEVVTLVAQRPLEPSLVAERYESATLVDCSPVLALFGLDIHESDFPELGKVGFEGGHLEDPRKTPDEGFEGASFVGLFLGEISLK